MFIIAKTKELIFRPGLALISMTCSGEIMNSNLLFYISYTNPRFTFAQQVQNLSHSPFSMLLKGSVDAPEDIFIDVIPVAWELLLESDQQLASTAGKLSDISFTFQSE